MSEHHQQRAAEPLYGFRPVPPALVTPVGAHDAHPSPEPPERRRIVVAGTSATIVEALGVALAGQYGLEVISTAMNETDLFDLIARRRPDGVVIYVPRLDTDTIKVVDRLKIYDPVLRIVMLAGRPSMQVLAYAAEAGAAACLSLNVRLRDLAEAVRADTTDIMLVDAASLSAPADGRRVEVADRTTTSLTRRELEVLSMMADGCSPPVIAARLVISIYTARGHVKSVLRKLGAHSQLQAVAVARRLNLASSVASAPARRPAPGAAPGHIASIAPVNGRHLLGWRRNGQNGRDDEEDRGIPGHGH